MQLQTHCRCAACAASKMSKAGTEHFDQGGHGIDPRDADTPDNWVSASCRTVSASCRTVCIRAGGILWGSPWCARASLRRFPFPFRFRCPKQHAAIKRSLTFHTVVRLSLLQVPRHPELIRLTGRHPFNIEPPLTTLMDQGLITSPDIHIVRNHGAVPKLDWETHK